MIPRSISPVLCALLAVVPLTAGDEAKPDRELAVLESRLQAERAAAVRARLILYTDELQKLETQYTTAGDTAAASAVQEERKSVDLAMKRLEAIAKGKTEPAEPGELKPKEVLDDTTLAARRINAIIAQFSSARTEPGPAPDRDSPPGQTRSRVFKMNNAVRNREHAKLEGASYWAYDNSYAVWSPDDLIPGEYNIVLRYTGSKCGGKATVRIAKQNFEVSVPVPEKGQKIEPLPVGTVKITERGADIRVESNGKASGSEYLWNLQSLDLKPVQRP